MFIGYSDNHTSNVYQFLKLGTHQVIHSRDVTWLNQSYGEFKKLKQPDILNIEVDEEERYESIDEEERDESTSNPVTDDEEDNLEEIQENPNNQEEQENSDEDSEEEDQIVGPIPRAPSCGREIRNLKTSYNPFPTGTNREVRNLTTSYNPDPLEHAETAMLARMYETAMLAKIFEKALLSTIHDGNPEPKTYKEAKQSIDWKAWWTAMCTEFKNMEEKKVWEIKLKKDLPAGRELIGNRWVYAQKDDGRYRARTVAKGFSQVPGKDFQENLAPVVNDTTFHIMLVLKILLQLYAGQFDIETAFL
jgi:Reverse transcriptase (RNA-dependent DNA polymerase)